MSTQRYVHTITFFQGSSGACYFSSRNILKDISTNNPNKYNFLQSCNHEFNPKVNWTYRPAHWRNAILTRLAAIPLLLTITTSLLIKFIVCLWWEGGLLLKNSIQIHHYLLLLRANRRPESQDTSNILYWCSQLKSVRFCLNKSESCYLKFRPCRLFTNRNILKLAFKHPFQTKKYFIAW